MHRKQSFIETGGGGKDKGGREREKKDGCLLCNFIKRRVLLAHEENSFVFRAKESRRIPPFYPSIADNYVDNYNLSLSII